VQQHHVAFPITDASQLGEARRLAVNLATRWGLEEADCGRLGIVLAEAGRNLVQHGGGGQLLLGPAPGGGIELLVLDQGPGMANLPECLRDGYSTAGTPGNGLGAIRRLSDVFDIYTGRGQGTALLLEIHSRRNQDRGPQPWQVGAVSVAVAGEQVCGDSWSSNQAAFRSMLMVVDGIGHGPAAAEAAQEAVRVFRSRNSGNLHDTMGAIHVALKKTRGAAVGLAMIDKELRQLRFVGVGNIAGAIVSPKGSHSVVSSNGLAGHVMRRVHEFTYEWQPDATLLMHSDGLATWRLDHYPGLLSRRPALIAGVLYRDFRRKRDDVTVLVAREAPQD
jgi:anti-sigma regulatory factor (Ser/Thr protein kinase)